MNSFWNRPIESYSWEFSFYIILKFPSGGIEREAESTYIWKVSCCLIEGTILHLQSAHGNLVQKELSGPFATGRSWQLSIPFKGPTTPCPVIVPTSGNPAALLQTLFSLAAQERDSSHQDQYLNHGVIDSIYEWAKFLASHVYCSEKIR